MSRRDREPETPEQRAERVFAEFDRTFSTDRRGRMRIRNPAKPYALAGLAGGLLLALGLALAGRGGLVVVTVLQLAGLLLPVAFVTLFLLSLVARRWGRRTAGRLLGGWISCLLALVVLRAAATVIDSGMRDVL